MSARSRMGRIALAATLAVTGMGAIASSAGAAFHFMSIREVGSGPDYVELQMYAPGQNFVDGHTIQTFDNAGNPIGTPFVFPPGANTTLNGDNQRTILVGEAAVNPDFTAAFDVVMNSGGGVCFDSIDCVTFGLYGGGPFGSPTGSPVAPAGIPGGQAIIRSIAPGCATLLEPTDDTNDSATDFSVAPQNPRKNSTAPVEQSCLTGGNNPGGGPDTKIDKGPKKKTKKKKATFEFSSTTVGATFECGVDGKPFEACTSPLSAKVKKGKHSFQVRAVLNGVPDGSPAEQSWKVKKPKK